MMGFPIFTAVYAIGIVQAIVLAVAILRTKRPVSVNNQILLALLIAIVLVLSQYMLVVNRMGRITLLLPYFAAIGWFAIGPLFYLYSRSLTQPKFRWKPIYSLLFVFSIYQLLQLLVHLAGWNVGLYLLFKNYVVYSYAWVAAYVLHGIIFGALALLCIRKSEENVPSATHAFYRFFVIVMILAGIFLIVISNGFQYFYMYERYLVAIFAAFVLILAFQSLRISQPNQKSSAERKYSNSGLSKKELESYHSILTHKIEEGKVYLDQKLTLSKLSQLTAIKENHLSQLFSQYLHSNFYDFINGYRLAELELRLNDAKYAHMKIAALAQDCGFNSKAAFYKSFKQKHGMTPTEYMKTRTA